MRTLTFLLLASALHAQNIVTKCGSNDRACAFTDTVLTPDAVRARGMVALPTIPQGTMPDGRGDARGVEAQPLIYNGIMVLASDFNVIRAVHPTDGTGIWQTGQLCTPVNSTPQNDMWRIQDHFGFLSTGVIDAETNKLYQVATCSKDGTGSQASMQQRMFVLDVRTGRVLSTSPLNGSGGGANYSDASRKQRGALALWKQNGVKFVLIEAGSFNEYDTSAGWLLAYDTFDDQVKATLPTHCGMWQSGLGPAIDDATGLIYIGCGNGPFDHVTAFGESAMQIQFTPPTTVAPPRNPLGCNECTGVTSAKFTVLHAWAPFSDAARTCANPQLTTAKTAGKRLTGAAMPMAGMPCDQSWGDQDAFLTGTLLPKQHLFLGAGKDGIAYAIDTQHFPDTQPADFGTHSLYNCSKVSMYQLGWDLGIASCQAVASQLNIFPGGKTRHQHAPLVHFEQNGVTYVLAFAENSPLQLWRVYNNGTMEYVARGTEMASSRVASGMAGGFCAVSSNGGANAIAWCSVPWTDVNRTVGPGRLIAYDLSNVASLAAKGTIPTLWTSADFTINKFSTPIIWQGEVILPNFAGGVMEWGLGK